jgi:hypothetical protein
MAWKNIKSNYRSWYYGWKRISWIDSEWETSYKNYFKYGRISHLLSNADEEFNEKIQLLLGSYSAGNNSEQLDHN